MGRGSESSTSMTMGGLVFVASFLKLKKVAQYSFYWWVFEPEIMSM